MISSHHQSHTVYVIAPTVLPQKTALASLSGAVVLTTSNDCLKVKVGFGFTLALGLGLAFRWDGKKLHQGAEEHTQCSQYPSASHYKLLPRGRRCQCSIINLTYKFCPFTDHGEC